MRPRLRTLRALARRQRGASYSLPLVLIVPFYLMFVVAVFEFGFLLLARAGTQYAAYAAARAVIVWDGEKPEDVAKLRPKQAAWAHLAPFVGGRQRELDNAGPIPPEALEAADAYTEAVRRYMTPAGGSESSGPSAEFLRRKFLTTAARTEIKIEPQTPDGPHKLMRVTVTYRAPLYMPVASRFVDPDGQQPFEYPLTATVTLTAEGPETESRTIGIEYSPDRTEKKEIAK